MGLLMRLVWLALVLDCVIDGGGYAHSQIVIVEEDGDAVRRHTVR